jgi:glycosyltransferase involved in cell wall biosynthesis
VNASDVRLSVVVPVYNEAGQLREVVRRLRSVPVVMELICVDDGSTDGSASILEDLRHRGEVDAVVRHERNRGKGAAVRSGIERATGALIVVHDADLEYDPRELPALMQPILEGRADAVFGSRFLDRAHPPRLSWHRVGNRALTRFSNLFTALDLTDMETCYKMVRADLLKRLPLRANRFGIEPEVTACLAWAGARIHEVPIRYRARSYAEGKKIGWRDGVAAFWHILRSNVHAARTLRHPPTWPTARPQADRT